MKVYHGAILTCDAQDRIASYLVEDRGEILYVGDQLPAQYAGAETVEVTGALTPSFADTHIHFASFATFHAGLNVMEARSNPEILDWLSDYQKTSSEKLIIGFGASPYSVSDGHLVTRAQLDSVCPDRPVFMVKYDGHACVVNSALLRRLEGKLKGLRGYHPDTGEMNQEAFFAVSNAVTNAISPVKLVKNMQKAIDFMASKGIGMIHTVSGVGFPMDLDVDMERWMGRGLKNGMQYRVFFQTMDVKKVQRRGLPRIGGCFATALDGCFGSMDAALLRPYEHQGADRGVLYYTDQQVTDFCKRANRAGLQIELHAIGDDAFRQATQALKAALDDFPRADHRHGIIHACLPTQEGLDICQQYQIHLPVQTAFINWPQEPDSYLASILGPERSERLNPLRDFWDRGIVVSAGSDGPCTNPDPIQWIAKACNHSVPSQRLTVAQALRMCTCHGYYATFDEKRRGSLEAGKVADMTLLSENPFQTPVEKLSRIAVEQLLLQGQPYQPVTGGPIGQVLRGMGRKG